MLKCTNKEETITYEKHLRKLAENAILHLQEGLNAKPDAPILGEVMLTKDFKRTVAEMYNCVHHDKRMEILKSIKDPEGECLWNLGDDDDGQEPPAQATVQQEERGCPEAEDFLQAWDEPLTDEQALMVTNLFRSHTCMLEWQGQVSMLLKKLTTSVSPKLFLAILNVTV